MENALLNMNRVRALDPDLDEQSHLFRLAFPLFHWGQVWDFELNGRRWGFKWLFVGIRFTDIVCYGGRHVHSAGPFAYVGLMR